MNKRTCPTCNQNCGQGEFCPASVFSTGEGFESLVLQLDKIARFARIALLFAVPLILIFLLGGCAAVQAPNTEKAFVQTSLADTATTTAVLTTGVGYEANPIGFAGATLAKAGLYYYAKDLPEAEQKSLYHTSSAAFGGISVNNLMVLIGTSTPASLLAGLLSAVYIYMNKPDEQPTTLAQGETK